MTTRPKRSQFLVFGSPLVTERETRAVAEVVASGWLGTGPKVAAFEEEFARYVGTTHAVAVNSCTAALHLSMVAAGIGPGDEVITTPLTFCATANAIVHTGATPVFVDVDPLTMNIDASRIEAAITPRTKAILPVHFAGRPCDMGAVMAIALARKLLVVDDAAHAIETRCPQGKIGAIADMTCFSFYVTKNVFTGEGGMVTTNNEELAARIKVNALHGMTKDAWKRFSDDGYKHYQVVFSGFKYNMMDMQAALGLVQMPLINERLARRNAIWRYYDRCFADLPLSVPSPESPGTTHARHLYTPLLQLDRLSCTRDQFMDALAAENIGTGVHYVSLHLQPYYRDRFGFRPDDFEHARDISERTLSLPLSPKLSDDDVEDVVAAVRGVARRFSR